MRWRRLEVKWLWTGHLYPRCAPASRMEDPMPMRSALFFLLGSFVLLSWEE